MATQPRLLVVDDDSLSCQLVRDLFASEGYVVTAVGSGEAALDTIATALPDVVILDVHLPGLGGVEVLERLRVLDPRLPVIILTGSGDIPSAVKATKLGAFAYLTKGLNLDEIVIVAKRAIEQRALLAEVEELKSRLAEDASLARSMGPSREVRRVIEHVAQVAPSDFTVLLQGETGTGKELVARTIHRESPRRGGPFVAIDCGAIPETLSESELFGHEKGAFTGADKPRPGHFQLAAGGTLFLDEVGNLSMALQAKLLRVLQQKEALPLGGRAPVALDVRIVAASNAELAAQAAEWRFRQDLYFRLAEFTITLPPLRTRLDDVPHFAWRFAQEVSIELRRPVREIDAEALDVLRAHPWPGNVRELRNVIRLAVLQCTDLVIGAGQVRAILERGSPAVVERPALASVPAPLPAGRSLKAVAVQAVEDAERSAIQDALVAAHGNKSQAARALQTDYKTLHVKIKQYGLGPPVESGD